MLQFNRRRLITSSAFMLGVALLAGACEVGGPKPRPIHCRSNGAEPDLLLAHLHMGHTN